MTRIFTDDDALGEYTVPGDDIMVKNRLMPRGLAVRWFLEKFCHISVPPNPRPGDLGNSRCPFF